MTDPSTHVHEVTSEDEIDLRGLLRIFWRKRLLIAVTALAFASASLALGLIVPKRYTASMLLMPVERSSGQFGGAGAVLSRFSGIASLMGVSATGANKSQEYIALLKSTLIAEKFIRKYNLLPIFYGSRWNAAMNRWKSRAQVPTLWEASRYFERKILSVARNSETGLVTLSISWKQPDLAANWANSLVELTNEYARKKAVDRAKREIAFLDEQAMTTKYVEERQAAFSIIQGELTKEMIAKGTNDYALKVIDPAFAPERPAFPKPVLWTLLGLLAGVVLGYGYAVIRDPASGTK